MKQYTLKLREARKAKGWTQKELAERIGTSQNNISRYETGQRQIKLTDWPKYAICLGTSIDYLIGLDDVPKRAE